MKGTTVKLRPTDVLHIPSLDHDGLAGYDPIAMAIACEECGTKSE